MKQNLHINIRPYSSEYHDGALKGTDRVKKDVDLYRERIGTIVKKKTKRKLQEKATPIREGTIPIEDHHTINDLIRVGNKLKHRFGIKVLRIVIREIDTMDTNSRQAHILFGWIDERTGRSIKLDRIDMSQMQYVVRDELKSALDSKNEPLIIKRAFFIYKNNIYFFLLIISDILTVLAIIS